MQKSTCFHKLLTLLLVSMLILQVTGCGTLLYPERRGRTSGQIDPGVAILDGVGLLLFVVPGLVAFAIDFTTGAIYLPPKSSKLGLNDTEKARCVYVNPDSLRRQNIEGIIAKRTGHSVRINQEDLVISKLERPEDFIEQYDRLVALGKNY